MLVVLGLTVGVSVLCGFLFYFLDSREKEPLKYLLLAFGFGILAAIFEILIFRVALLKFFYGHNLLQFTVLLNDEIDEPSVMQAVWSSVIIGGFLKEGLKNVAFGQLVRQISHEVDEPFDSIVYAVMLSLGFQFFENLLFLRTDFVTENFFGVIGLLKHLVCGVIMGYFHQRYRFNHHSLSKTQYLTLAISCQMFVHITLRFGFMWHNLFGLFLGGILLLLSILVAINLITKARN